MKLKILLLIISALFLNSCSSILEDDAPPTGLTVEDDTSIVTEKDQKVADSIQAAQDSVDSITDKAKDDTTEEKFKTPEVLKPVTEQPIDEKPEDNTPVDEKPVDEKPIDDETKGTSYAPLDGTWSVIQNVKTDSNQVVTVVEANDNEQSFFDFEADSIHMLSSFRDSLLSVPAKNVLLFVVSLHYEADGEKFMNSIEDEDGTVTTNEGTMSLEGDTLTITTSNGKESEVVTLIKHSEDLSKEGLESMIDYMTKVFAILFETN